MPHTEPPEDCQLCKNAVQYYNTKGDAVDKKEDAVPIYKVGDRVRVTYDTMVLDANFYSSYGIRVKTPVSIVRETEGDRLANAYLTVPLKYLTPLGPESDPVGTARVKRGKDFAVAVKRKQNPFETGARCDWAIVASADPTQLSLYLNDYLVKDWDVLGA